MVKVLLNIFFAPVFIFVGLILYHLVVFPKSVIAQQACYLFEDEFSRCISPGGSGNSCPSSQYYCPGYTNPDRTGQTCWACVSGPTEEKLSCSQTAGPPNTGRLCDPDLGYTYTGGCTSGSQCTGTYNDGCKYCVAPVCNQNGIQDNGETGVDCGGGGCPACASLSCAVTSVTPTGPTTADATSDDTGGDFSGYDRVDWFLNDGYVGTTAMNTTNGTSSNSFTNLVAGTQYNLGAHYVDTEGGRPAVSCTGYTFQFNPPSTQTTCSLTADPQSLSIGQYSSWTLSSTNEPSGAQALWHITAGGTTSTRTTAPDYIDTVLYNSSGSDSRWVEVKNSSGNVLCTTDTMQVYVNLQNRLRYES